ncbi:MAG: PLP-dependent aminotransferase family protein [Syntrophomonadaceae bacterium]|nr:PLP-dependent aminotransferase family protein [Syntrophomonadaceae bacterium]
MQYPYSERMSRIRSSVIRELLKITEQPEVISMAGGLPADELFPVEEIKRAADAVLSGDNAPASLQYGPTEGYLPLRQQITLIMNDKGVACSPGEVQISSGSQQALDLLARVFLDRGDVVLVENPTYLGAIQAFELFQPKFVAVATDEEGMLPEALEQAIIINRPKIIYLVPTFQNPTGRTMSLERRKRVAGIIERQQVLVIEDDPYSDLRFEGEDLPLLKSLVPDWVVYLGTFSKTAVPGFRLGWIVADEELIGKLSICKQGADLHTNTLVQHVLSRYLNDADIPGHIKKIRNEYGRRCNAMVEALEREFPSGVTWSRPQGGMFLWVQLPAGLDTESLMSKALLEKIAFVPGHSFFVNGGGQNTMRLNFSNSSPDLIEEGIRRLARLVNIQQGKDSSPRNRMESIIKG